MSSIPLEVLCKIEEQQAELAPIIHDLMATSDPVYVQILEKRLANLYMASGSALTPEETLKLSACSVGNKYGEVSKSQLH